MRERRTGAAVAVLVVAVVLAAPARAAEPTPAPEATPAASEAVEPAPPPPVDEADRAALAALALTMPRHGLLPPRAPAPDAPDDAWRAFARRLVDAFAPASMRRDARQRLVEEARPLAARVVELVPRHRRYQALVERLEAMARQVDAPQVTIPETPYKVRVGTTAPEVGLLRDRLLAEGYGDPGPPEGPRDFFDDRLKRALQSWQKDQGLPPTVVLDPLTRRRLNAPIAPPIAEVILALSRWRALDLRADAGRHVLVDMTRYELVAERDGAPELTMPVVVGKPTERDATPARTAPLEAVIVNPAWHVPTRIVDESLRPQASNVPEVLMDMGYDVTVDASGRWRVRMPPGPDNPLGKLKFQLANTNGIYLHDTPARHVFGKAERTLSHGCVRLSQPEALARWLLPDRGFDLTNAMALPTLTQSFGVPSGVPVHFIYQTIGVGPSGRLERRPDIYGRDAEALADIDAAAVLAALRELIAAR
ncbi:MAG: L,D-transpeptidase family protein [Deltaproteobacteria bacterium]|nr:L,D-transpeptidase family protein [Deltaproteobacteria bacterium]